MSASPSTQTPMAECPIFSVDRAPGDFSTSDLALAVQIFESGVLFLPNVPYILNGEESRFLDPAISDGKAKNVSFDPASGRVGGTCLTDEPRQQLAQMMRRFSDWAENLLLAAIPTCAPGLARGMTSLRPCKIEGRPSSLRKDDTRLHVDAFRSRPVQGRRILRVFANVNPHGVPRVWEVGEPFEKYAGRFMAHVHAPVPGSQWVLAHLGATKGRRTTYDHLMLQLHDLAKRDDAYQHDSPRTRMSFPSGTSWLVCTDATPHASLSGQHAFEQTFFVDADVATSSPRVPLHVLERFGWRALV